MKLLIILYDNRYYTFEIASGPWVTLNFNARLMKHCKVEKKIIISYI